MKKTISCLLVFIILFGACRKFEQVENKIFLSLESKAKNIINESDYEQAQFCKEHLIGIGREIALQAKDNAFVDFIHEEAKKKFDDEYHVLLNTIVKDNKWGAKFKRESFTNSLNVFKSIGKSQYFPQIYIPKFLSQEDDDGNLIPKPVASPIFDTSEQEIDPIFIFYTGNSEVDSATNTQDIYPGYKFDLNGSMYFVGMVNEDFANENEVWIISLNEQIVLPLNSTKIPQPEEGPCDPAIDPNCQGTGGGGGGGYDPFLDNDYDPEMELPTSTPFPNTDHSKVNCIMTQIKIYPGFNKESWVSGASEVAGRGFLHCHNNRVLGGKDAAEINYTSGLKSAYYGKVIKKVRRKTIKNGDISYINFTLNENWQYQFPYSDPIWFDFLIFERDLWPAKLNKNTRDGRYDLFNYPFDPPYTHQSANYKLYHRAAGDYPEGSDYNNVPYFNGYITNNLLMAAVPNQYAGTGYANSTVYGFMFRTKVE